jgi:hypothetical protein
MKTKRNKKNTGLGTSGESARESQELANRLRVRIMDMARRARERGLTINEAEREIDDHKAHSVSPRFSELIKSGELVRQEIGRGQPTRKFPHGSPRFATRYDEETRRNVIVHWVPEFEPSANEVETDEELVGVR